MNERPDNFSPAARGRFAVHAAVFGVVWLVACGSDGAPNPQPRVAGAGVSAPTPDPSRAMGGSGTLMPGERTPAANPTGQPASNSMAAPLAPAGDTGGGAPSAGASGSADAPGPENSENGSGTGTPAGPPTPASYPAAIHCKPRVFSMGEARLHMHHIHFNTQDPDAQIAFVQKHFNAEPVDFCMDEASGRTTRAAKTERAYFLYTKTAAPPSNMRNSRLAHVGYNTPDVEAELERLNRLGAPLADASVCATAAQGTPCNTFNVQWFYLETPETTRFEIASGPGPSTSGFAHIHLVAPTDSFFRDVIGEALRDPSGAPNVDGVNMVSSGRSGVLDDTASYEDTRGAPVDHIGLSTTDLEGELARIEDAGVKIEEPISFKPEYGFRSFMVRSPEGIWLEILEDAPFAQ